MAQESIVFKTTKQSHETNQFARIQEEKPNLYETEDDKNKVVLYFTSLRGIRKTYEDCCCVRTVLRGYQVAVEELGEEKPVCLPQVLIRGVHVGGMEEIKKLNDGGACGCCGDPSETTLWGLRY
ncbi:hypothetical protein Bca52824_072947 [Brassica carinata]|uniref:Glutaredoxin domain-containing protein n=1 Tax=Brassica carinata TaxID=52824 RepID=A0A8X7Q9P9_BRACI|nr:hypothetical protein Bca52824_072947 [Brassica carinata]